MKKLYLLGLLLILSTPVLKAQILIETHFDGYVGTPATFPAGWYASWHADTSQATLSYYTTSGCGLSCPAYKFGLDSVLVISPQFNNPDSVRFMLKGNGTQQVTNYFEVYSSPDSMNWQLEMSMDSIPASSQIVTLPLQNICKHVAFLYRKPTLGYNAGIDDIYVFQGAFPVSVKSNDKIALSMHPNPVSNKLNIEFGTTIPAGTEIAVLNILGKQVMNATTDHATDAYSINMNGFEEGIYFVRVQANQQTITKRIVVKH